MAFYYPQKGQRKPMQRRVSSLCSACDNYSGLPHEKYLHFYLYWYISVCLA